MPQPRKKKSQPIKNDQRFIEYSLNSVKDLEFQFKSLEEIDIDVLDISKVETVFQSKIIFRKEQKIISIYFKVGFVYNKKINIVQYAVRTDFLIYNYDDIVLTNEDNQGKVGLSTKFLISFYGITISTARGILISYLRKTDYENSLQIPIFFPDEIKETFIDPY
jgi:hypothetical protein